MWSGLRYSDDRVLLAMGKTLGKALKVYGWLRGRFARVCVEVDLKKTLVPKICLDEIWQKVEYEGI